MEWKHGELTRHVIACAMEAHRVLGTGFPEYVYRRVLQIEFESDNIASESEYPLPSFLKGYIITARRIDFMIEQIFWLEIKATSALEPGDFVPSLNIYRLGISSWACWLISVHQVFRSDVSITKSLIRYRLPCTPGPVVNNPVVLGRPDRIGRSSHLA